MTEHKSLTQEFVKCIVESSQEISSYVLRSAKIALIDYVASSFAGRHEPGIKKLLRIVNEEGGKEVVPIIGQSKKATMSQAALINGFIGHAIDFDDVHSDVRGHPSTVIFPVLFSVASVNQVTGQRFLEAYIIGVEVMARLGLAIGTEHYVKGWHNTSTLGTVAAAVAGGYLRGFSERQYAHVIGFAATQASGLRMQFGTESKPLHAGMAARAALFGIQLVDSGFKGAENGLDGSTGFLSVYGEVKSDTKEILINDWGKEWKAVTPGLWFKLYPFCSAAYHAADAAVKLRDTDIDPKDIARVNVIFPPQGDVALIHKYPETCEMGRFSIEYIVALILLKYPLGNDQFLNQPIPNDIREMMGKISRVNDDTIKPHGNPLAKGRFSIVQIKTIDGEELCSRIDFPKGSPKNPIGLRELKYKLHDALKNDDLYENLLNEIDFLEDKKTVCNLISLL